MGIEPTHKGFADLSLTTWVPRLIRWGHIENPRARARVKILERETGVEPATSTLARSHSTTELLPLVLSFYSTCTFADNLLHPHWHPPTFWLVFHVGHSATVRQETLDKLGLRVPCLAAVV